MKVKNVTPKNTTFEPITIEVVIESKEDLADLWHRMNLGSYAVNTASNKVCNDWQAAGYIHQLWSVLDEIARARGFVK